METGGGNDGDAFCCEWDGAAVWSRRVDEQFRVFVFLACVLLLLLFRVGGVCHVVS